MTWFGETIPKAGRTPDTLANQLANFVVIAMSRNLRVELTIRGDGKRVGRILRREVRPELFESDYKLRMAAKPPRPISSVVVHLDDGGDPLPLNDVSDIRSLRE